MAARNRLFVFDCDGTLVDSQHNIVAIMDQAFRGNGLTAPSASDIRRQVGLSLDVAVARLMPDGVPVPASQVARAYRAIAGEMRLSGAIREPLFPEIRQLIEALEAPNHFLAVATGKNMVGLLHTLADHGLRDRFHSLQTADRCLSKPNPDMVLRAMKETAAAPEDTVVIGDTTFDVEMAISAGATAIGVSWGYHDAAELSQAGAHHVLDRPLDLLKLVSRA
jgi:phosphoglycolate phosphatase